MLGHNFIFSGKADAYNNLFQCSNCKLFALEDKNIPNQFWTNRNLIRVNGADDVFIHELLITCDEMIIKNIIE